MSNTDQQRAALIAAKDELVTAYTSVHASLGRLINLVHGSDPVAVVESLGSEFGHSARSPSSAIRPAHQLVGHLPPINGSTPRPQQSSTRYADHPKPTNTNHHHHHSPQPQAPHPYSPDVLIRPPHNNHHPPGPSFASLPGAPHHSTPAAHQTTTAYRTTQEPQRKLLGPPKVSSRSYSHSTHPTSLETDEEEEEEDEGSEEDRYPQQVSPHYPQQQHTHQSFQKSAPVPTTTGRQKGKEKKIKPYKDPNAPKRPASAYILFQNAVRQEMRAANPSADYKELARQIGDRWKNLSEDAKRPWSEAGRQAMSSWNIQNKEYKTLHPEATSPHHHSSTSSGGGANGMDPKAAPRKRKSAPTKVEHDEMGNPLKKKRGRPAKAGKEAELVAPPAHQVVPREGTQTVAHPSMAVSHSVPQSAPQEFNGEVQGSDEGEYEEEEEEEEEGVDEIEENSPAVLQPNHENRPTANLAAEEEEEEEEEEAESEEEEEEEEDEDEDGAGVESGTDGEAPQA